ncbi:MAG TPA: mechanosensitive ion channel family protein [Terriglobales bacterium]|nr:mechanosensitive ion channel family protein [Terriglobales bacterium]
MSGPLVLIDLNGLMPTKEWHNLQEVMQQWRSDALELLRHDIPRILVILLVSLVLLWFLRTITHRMRALSKRQALPSGIRSQQLSTLAGVIKGVGIFVITFSALIQILGVLNIDVKPLIASAGVAGLAIGFGAQTLVKDVINGFFILLENQYDVGDVVKLGGTQGTVEDMTLRRTVLRDADGTVHTIPNSEIKMVSNLTRDWTQVALHITVAYSEDSERVIKLLRDIAEEMWNAPELRDLLVSAPEVPGIDRISGGDVDYLMLVKTRPGKQYQVTRDLRQRVKGCFQKNNIQPGGPGRMYVVDAGEASRKA